MSPAQHKANVQPANLPLWCSPRAVKPSDNVGLDGEVQVRGCGGGAANMGAVGLDTESRASPKTLPHCGIDVLDDFIPHLNRSWQGGQFLHQSVRNELASTWRVHLE